MEVPLRTISEFSQSSLRTNPCAQGTREPSHINADPASHLFGQPVAYEHDPPPRSGPRRLWGHGGDGKPDEVWPQRGNFWRGRTCRICVQGDQGRGANLQDPLRWPASDWWLLPPR